MTGSANRPHKVEKYLPVTVFCCTSCLQDHPVSLNVRTTSPHMLSRVHKTSQVTYSIKENRPKSTQTQVFRKGLVVSEHRQEGQLHTTGFFSALSEANPLGPEESTSPLLSPSPERQNLSSRDTCFLQRGINPCHLYRPSKIKQEIKYQQTGHKTCASASSQYHANQRAQSTTHTHTSNCSTFAICILSKTKDKAKNCFTLSNLITIHFTELWTNFSC